MYGSSPRRPAKRSFDGGSCVWETQRSGLEDLASYFRNTWTKITTRYTACVTSESLVPQPTRKERIFSRTAKNSSMPCECIMRENKGMTFLMMRRSHILSCHCFTMSIFTKELKTERNEHDASPIRTDWCRGVYLVYE